MFNRFGILLALLVQSHFYTLLLFRINLECSLWSRSVMLGSAERLGKSAVKVFSQNSNLYDNDTSTSQTDGQTDRQLAMAIPRSA